MALALLAFVAAVASCYLAAPVVLPSVVALFLAMLVAPPMRWLMKLRLGRGWASFLAVTLAMGLLYLAAFGCWRAVAGVVEQAPQYQSELKKAATRVEAKFKRLKRTTQKLVPEEEGGSSQQGEGGQKPQGGGGEGAPSLAGVLLRGLGTLMEATGLALFVPFLALFLLMEAEPLARAFDRASGSRFDGARLRREAPRMARAYVFGNVVLAFALAVIQGGLFLAFGLDNAVGLGLVTGFLNVIPILGVPVAVALPVLQGLGTLGGGALMGIAGVIVALHLIAANWVIPRTIGVHVKVNSTAATLAMLFFSWLWGLTGFLMAVPLCAVIKIALECSADAKHLAPLLAAHED